MEISPTQSEVFKAVRTFLLPLLYPTTLGNTSTVAAAPVVQGQNNRLPEVKQKDFVVMWPLRSPRLATNANEYADCVFTASIAATTMTVTAVDGDFPGTIRINDTVFGPGIAANTKVTAFGTGTGGVGTYTITPTQTLSSRALAAGTQTLINNVDAVIQLDVHGPRAMDNSGIISGVFFDEVAFDTFAAMDPPIDMRPLYVEDPKQLPFVNDQQQYEDRVVLEAHFNVNQNIRVPQQYADQIEVDLVNVDTLLP